MDFYVTLVTELPSRQRKLVVKILTEYWQARNVIGFATTHYFNIDQHPVPCIQHLVVV